jgi:hypothetical protein
VVINLETASCAASSYAKLHKILIARVFSYMRSALLRPVSLSDPALSLGSGALQRGLVYLEPEDSEKLEQAIMEGTLLRPYPNQIISKANAKGNNSTMVGVCLASNATSQRDSGLRWPKDALIGPKGPGRRGDICTEWSDQQRSDWCVARPRQRSSSTLHGGQRMVSAAPTSNTVVRWHLSCA